MIIGVTGYGASGASACVALIKEFENVQHYNGNYEFQLLQQPDGIRDLKFNLVESRRRISINSSIHRFITQYKFGRSNGSYMKHTNGKYKEISRKYVDSLVQVEWKGKSVYDPKDVLGWLEMGPFRLLGAIIRRGLRVIHSRKQWPPKIPRYYTALTEEEFVCKTKKYLSDIFEASGFEETKPLLLEQLFCLERPTEGGEYFDDFRSIIVERDPRDVFMLSNGYMSDMCPFMPNTGDVEAFVKYYKGLHYSRTNDEKVLYINFEDLIYDYENSISRISRFLGLEHVNIKAYFKPEWSINNTQVYLKYPKYQREIEYIEENLSEYLYDFDNMKKNIKFEYYDMGMFDEKPGDKKRMIKKNKF